MRIIRNLFLLVILGLGVACVPMNQFKTMEERKQDLSLERDMLKKANERLVVDTTEMGASLRRILDENQQLSGDTFQLGRSLLRMTERYESALDQNKELAQSKEKLAKGSEAEARRLLKDLQAAQEDLLIREDELKALEDKLWDRKKNLEALQAEVEEKNKTLEEKSQRLVELENMLARKDSAVNALRTKVADALFQFEKDGLSVEIRNGKVYVSLEEQLLFKTGKSDIDPKGQSAIIQLAKVLEQNPDINILIEGHTDDVPYKGKGQLVDNWDLSVKRATTIIRILTANSKIDPKRLSASGRGEYVPIDTGKSAASRQKNRRTEIILTPKLDELFEILENN